MAVSFVQFLGSVARSSTGQTVALSGFGGSSAAGNTIIVTAIQASINGFTSVTDSAGNTYVKVAETTVGTSHTIATFVAVNAIKLGATQSITLTSAVSNQYPVISGYEFSSINGTVDAVASAVDAGTSSATYSVPAVATPGVEHLLFGVVGISGASRTITTDGTWKSLNGSSAAPSFARTADAIWDSKVGGDLGVAGAINVSARWCAHLVALAVAAPVVSPLTSKWVGAVTSSAATVAVKVTGANARLKVGTDTGLTTGTALSGTVTADANGIAKLTVSGLVADTVYYYGVEVDGSGTFEAGGQFKTFPSGAASFSFAFGSCTNADDATSFTRLKARNPDLFIHLGDLAYDDPTANDQSLFRAFYDRALAAQNQGAVLGNIPTAYVWSDHDYGGNNSTGDAVAKPAAQAAYREYVPHYTLPDAAGIYQTFVIGRVRFILTDNRSFKSSKSDPDDANKTILGAAQKQWFKGLITDSTEQLIIWGCENTWITPVTAGEDDWGGYSTERAELGAFIAASGKNVMMIAGDMHAMAADDGTNSVGGFVVLQQSPFYNTNSAVTGTYSQGSYSTAGFQQFYGIVDVVDDGTDITMTYNGYDTNDVSQITLTKVYSPPPVVPSLWTSIADLPQPRTYAVSAMDSDGRLYVVGGNNFGPQSTVYRFDPAANAWSTVAPLPQTSYEHKCASDAQGRIYAIGLAADATKVYRYDPAADAWSAVAPMPGPTPRSSHAAAADTSGLIYVSGGNNGFSFYNNFARYDPSADAWTVLAALPEARYGHISVVDASGRVYVIAGSNSGFLPQASNYRYDPGTDTWSSLALMPAARALASGGTDQLGRIYVIGGSSNGSSSGVVATVFRYDPDLDHWDVIDPLPAPRWQQGSASDMSGKVYAVGGSVGGSVVASSLVRDFADTPSPWSYWDGAAEVALTLDGVWNGASVDPVASVEIAP